MCARTTKNTLWSDWVEPRATKPPSDDAVVYARRDPAWVRDVVPMFPVDSYVPGSKCPHHGPIRPGSLFCCMVCSRSGMDADPALRRDPATEPKPEPRPEPARIKLSRRQRRARTAA